MKKILFIFLSTILLTVNAQDYFSQVSCNFDSDWCNFSPNKYFIRYTGSSPSITSGPTEDRTGDSFYALCNGKLLLDQNEKCVFSQNVSLASETDLKFWYHMSGAHIGTLEVILNETDIIWSLSGRQKNEWLEAKIQLPIGVYSLEFSANRSTSGRSSCDIALDDIYLQGQPLTTQLVTVTRTTAVPKMNISSDFDTLGNLNGWHTLFEKNDWIQADGVSNVILGYYGPGSDWSSITTGLKNITFNRPLNTSCSIPFVFSVYPDKKEFYCKKVSIYNRNNFLCGLKPFPFLSEKAQLASCTLGKYLMITSDKFDSDIGSYRSRLYSPVFKLNKGQSRFCLSFKYNILTSSNDGFKVYVENYLFQSEYMIVFDKRGPLSEDKWYSVEVPVTNVTYEQIIIFFEPIRGENRDFHSSISIDSVNLEYRECDSTLIDFTTQNTQLMTTEHSSSINSMSLSENSSYNSISTISFNRSTPSQSVEIKTTSGTTPVSTNHHVNDNLTTVKEMTITNIYVNKSTNFILFSTSLSAETSNTMVFENQTSIDNSSEITTMQSFENSNEKSYTAIYVTVSVISSIIIIASGAIIFKKYILKYIIKDKLGNNEIELN